MPKKLNWVESLVAENQHVETPESWMWWSLLCCISASAGNNYYLPTLKGDLIYKPNIYVMLLGESGLGKGYPVNLAKRLVQKTNVTRVISGRSSIQAIVKELATTKTIEGAPMITDSRGFIVNGELSTAIIQDPDSLTILTDLYDGHDKPEWTNLLKGDGAEKLKYPYITALFGSSPAHFYDSIPQVNIEGGYIGRNLIIYEEVRARNVDLLDEKDDKQLDDKFEQYIVPKYCPHLEKIGKHKGRLIPNDDARVVFNKFRRQWREKQTYDKTGFLNRVPDHILKVGMCLSLAEDELTGEISVAHMEEAIDRITKLVYSSRRTTEGRGPDPLAAPTKMILDFLIAADNQELPKRVLLSRGYGTVNTFSLDQIIENLLELGWIQRNKINGNQDWLIRLAGEPKENYVKYIESRKK